MKSDLLRHRFISFFEDRKHAFIPSSPITIKDDPTLLFVNAGMNQFKEVFLGNIKPKANRVVNSQKCLRVSGKHNDLDEVGHDTYHHTMFEMLGNWSFGDYFKQEAIKLAWDFLVKDLKISEERLYVTFFEGDSGEKLISDNETKNFWKQIIALDKILPGSKKDNFWEMGSVGPCGPCTEIHIDLRSESEIKNVPASSLINQDHPQVIEIWNLVFIEFNRKENGTLENLPNKHVDTGMGFERLCMVLQDKKSTYDTDVFSDLIKCISSIAKVPYGQSKDTDIAIRVIVDHIRAIGFSIADGQLPSNTGAGYVIRRILRRAVRYGYTYLNLKDPFLYKLIDDLSSQFKSFFPEIDAQKSVIKNIVKEEEKAFLKTLGKGLTLINKSIEKLTNKKKKMNGSEVFNLYDTYGFPPDLTELILKEKGLSYDHTQFKISMEKQKQRSRSASEIKLGDWISVNDIDAHRFIGYDAISCVSKIVKYRQVSSKGVDHFHIVFEQTPFYPEGGGQIGDVGIIYLAEDTEQSQKFVVEDTKKENNTIIHVVKTLPLDVQSNSVEYLLCPDYKRRQLITRNHSATHLLHYVLKKILGDHVEQKGSYVGRDYLRFDFSHFEKIDASILLDLEEHINNFISEGIALKEFRSIPINEAKNMGATALFGEKYGDQVRVIKFGDSIELCGGTHVDNTSEIGFIKITSESSIASGIRRIEAVTSVGALNFVDQKIRVLTDLSILLKTSDNIIGSVEKIITENKELTTLAQAVKNMQSDKIIEELSNQFIDFNGFKALLSQVDIDAGAMKDVCFQLIQKHNNIFVALATKKNNKVILNIAISKDLVKNKNLNASKIINKISSYINGRGGGQPFFAVSSGDFESGLQDSFSELKKQLNLIK